MVLWLVFAVLTGAAVLVVLWPLTQRARPASDRANDMAVYRDQLAEIERDRERGLIGEIEANAARVEVSRRLLEADDAARRERPSQPTSATTRRRAAAVIALVAVPAIALGFYTRAGSPHLPDMPLEARLQVTPENASIEQLIARVEDVLKRNPNDGEGWEVIGPVYANLGRYEDARIAFANAIRVLGPSAKREANLAEMAVVIAGNMVTAEARAGFQRALALEPAHAKARYYLALAKQQDGDNAGALADWKAIASTLPANSAERRYVERSIARAEGGGVPALPGPSAEDMAAARDMPAADQRQMISGMVERLAERLGSQGGSVDEWLRLINAYSVLNEPQKLADAIAGARRAFENDRTARERIEAAAKSLGVGG